MPQIDAYPMRESLEAFFPGGHAALMQLAGNPDFQETRIHDGLHSTSREDTTQGPLVLPVTTIPPDVLSREAPWVIEWYRGPLLEKAREFAGALVVASENPDNFPLINIHRGRNLAVGESYEAHVDSNYPTGLYFIGEEDRTSDTGGALVFSSRGDVPSRAEVLESPQRYYPKVGELAIMEGYGITHFVEPSTDGLDRVMVVFNFWTREAPEIGRASGLSTYQIGRKI